MSLIPTLCLDALPLKPEPISVWSRDGDLFWFLLKLYDVDAEMIDEEGHRSAVNYRSYGETLYQRGQSLFLGSASEFRSLAESHQDTPIPCGPIRIDKPIDFTRDASFGFMAKHAIAWDAVVDDLLSDNGFFSLPHILEARTELDCSVLLAKHLYYKEALQVLRGLLELNVLHVHFAADEAAYADWQKGNYRIPNMRGNRPGQEGLLHRLCTAGAISPDIKEDADRLYDELNGTIHSTEASMVNAGLRSRQWAGLQFKEDQFRRWCEYVGRVVAVGTRLLAAMLQQIQGPPRQNGIVCSTCRTVGQFVVEERSREAVTLRCLRCGWQSGFTLDYARRHGFS
jgi:hypothetical protein